MSVRMRFKLSKGLGGARPPNTFLYETAPQRPILLMSDGPCNLQFSIMHWKRTSPFGVFGVKLEGHGPAALFPNLPVSFYERENQRID